ncbi:hypothetical protein DUNSADRAFT_3580, partial [Dunaliella salina]
QALPKEADVVVVGAGVAGLACSIRLAKAGVKPLLLEAGDGVGGRVRTDEVDGFLLDRGFQIFLTGYPEQKAILDYEALDLQPFYAGAAVRLGPQFHRVADPFRHPIDAILTLNPVHPIGSPVDKILVGLVRFKSLLGSIPDIMAAPETSIEERLKAEGFSPAIIDTFFRPFLGGIFFDNSLGTTSRLFQFVMRMLATGSNCLPKGGIGKVAQQMASQLPQGCVELNQKVEKVERTGEGSSVRITLADGSTVTAKRGVVVAVEGPEASRLLGDELQVAPSKPGTAVGTCCLYFSSPSAPTPQGNPGNILYLNGERQGIVNNMCVPSEVSPAYAPPGRSLISVSTVGTYPELSEAELEQKVREHLSQWWGAQEVDSWQHLRTYRIPFAQPNQAPPTNFSRPVSLGGGLYVCGDHRDSATLDGTLVSGRRAAEALLAS